MVEAAKKGARTYGEAVLWEGTGELIQKYVLAPAAKKATSVALKAGTVRGLTTLTKNALKIVKPLVEDILPSVAKEIPKVTYKGSEAARKSLLAFSKTQAVAVAGDLAGSGLISAVFEVGVRLYEHKPLTTKAAVFRNGSAAIKGSLQAAVIAAAIAVAPAAATAAVAALPAFAIIAGTLAVAAVVTIAVDYVAKGPEKAFMQHMGIGEND